MQIRVLHNHTKEPIYQNRYGCNYAKHRKRKSYQRGNFRLVFPVPGMHLESTLQSTGTWYVIGTSTSSFRSTRAS